MKSLLLTLCLWIGLELHTAEPLQQTCLSAVDVQDTLPMWSQGFLDIHHINTGEGNSTWLKLPDGTTVLLDAGTVDKEQFERTNFPLKATSSLPDQTMSVAERITWYIEKMNVGIRSSDTLDYLIVSHFHSDHYGAVPELLAKLPVGTLIDRDYPKYDFPADLSKILSGDEYFADYMRASKELRVEQLVVGQHDQIRLKIAPEQYPSFHMLNVKNNASIWNPKTQKVDTLFSAEDMLAYYKGKYNENPLSMAFKISYGRFDYYNGADNTGLQDGLLPNWFDVESPIAAVVGEVDAMVLDHHGNRDANNATLLGTLNPRVVVQQVYSSDQPGQEVYYRLKTLGNIGERLIYATNMHPETVATYGPWFQKGYQSMQGHVVIRVYPHGDSYQVYVLDEEDLHVKQKSALLSAR